MGAKLTLDKAGRIVLPKPLRDELQLTPGDALEIETCGEEITLRPVRGNAPLRKKRGIWVYRVGEPLRDALVQEARRQVRRERDEDNLGKGH
ncbi:MAG: AbrB/MazE/SpoVT family DNA-binding domain-containing protein [Terriglobia bacterium]